MATPTLQDVLAAVPAAAIDEMTELIPGVPSNEQNLKQLLEFIGEDCVQIGNDPDKPTINLHTVDYEEEGKNIFMNLHSPGIDPVPGVRYDPASGRRLLPSRMFSCSSSGLMQAISTGKRDLKRYRDEGPCTGCETPRSKKMKLEGMPYCGSCMLEKALSV